MRPPEKESSQSEPLRLERLPGRYAICRLDPDEPLPDWATPQRAAASSAPGAAAPVRRTSPFLHCITRTDRELSIVIDESLLPQDLPITKIERGFAALRIAGTLDFALVGILARLTTALAEAEVPVFVVSTFETDYLLMRNTDVDRAITALRHVSDIRLPGGAGG